MANNSLVTLALVALVVSVVAAGYSYVASNNVMTGFATSIINLTVESSASINFTTATIQFGSGRVNDGAANATLNTVTNSVGNSNFTANNAGLVLENIGNVNVSLVLGCTSNSTALFGGTNPQYLWNVSNVEANSCADTAQNITFGSWVNANTTMRVCERFGYANSADSLRIDVYLVVPSDSSTGYKSDTITATATATG